jgi:hypothetical protein
MLVRGRVRATAAAGSANRGETRSADGAGPAVTLLT